MPPRTSGNGIPNWPATLRRAALPTPSPAIPPALMRHWRNRAYPAPGSASSNRTGSPAKAARVEITIAPAMSSGCRS